MGTSTSTDIQTDEILREERRCRMLRFIKERKSVSEIADIEKVTNQTVRNDIKLVLKRYYDEQTGLIEEFRSRKLIRFESMIEKLFSRANGAEDEDLVKMFNTIIKIEERVSRMLGTDAPQQRISRNEHKHIVVTEFDAQKPGHNVKKDKLGNKIIDVEANGQ